MNALRCIFSSRTFNYLRQNAQNAIVNVTQPTAIEASIPSVPNQSSTQFGCDISTPQIIPKSLIEACNLKAKRFNTNNGNGAGLGSISPTTLKSIRRMQRKVELVYLCKLCNTRNTKIVNEAAYKSGVVILQCDGCAVDHLIIDHLGWFANTKNKNIDEILAGHADRVRVIKVNEKGELI